MALRSNNLSEDMMKVIESRYLKKDENDSPRDRQILSEILNASNKIAIDGRFGPATSIEISEYNLNSLNESTNKKIKHLFEIKINNNLNNKIRVYRDYDELDIDMYIKLIGKDSTKEKMINNQEYFVAI